MTSLRDLLLVELVCARREKCFPDGFFGDARTDFAVLRKDSALLRPDDVDTWPAINSAVFIEGFNEPCHGNGVRNDVFGEQRTEPAFDRAMDECLLSLAARCTQLTRLVPGKPDSCAPRMLHGALARFTGLKELVIAFRTIKKQDAARLGSAFAQMAALTKLDLGDCEIMDPALRPEGMYTDASAPKVCATLVIAAQTLADHRSLRTLVLPLPPAARHLPTSPELLRQLLFGSRGIPEFRNSGGSHVRWKAPWTAARRTPAFLVYAC